MAKKQITIKLHLYKHWLPTDYQLPLHCIPWLCQMVPWAIGQNAQLMSPYNSNVHEPNFTKRRCENSLDVAIRVVFVLFFPDFLQFPRSGHPKMTESKFSLKNRRFSPQFFKGNRFSWGSTINE